jgi:ubiquinone/menaquinone biosynthesis C-methylase UbiE
MKNNSKGKQTNNNSKIAVFKQNIERYENWFNKNRFAYLSELEGVKSLVPRGRGIEIGVGTGRFAGPLGIEYGIDPSLTMQKKAKERGVKVIAGVAENLPITSNSFDFALITTTLCFLSDIEKTFSEIKRILNKNGFIILGLIDRESFLGELYLKKKEKNPFYRFANFYSVKEVIKKLKKAGFSNPEIKQTLFSFPEELRSINEIKDSYGKGGFVIIRMRKKREV